MDKPPRDQVFINFRGKELRTNFIWYLKKGLEDSGVNVFIDAYEEKGNDLENLFKRIEQSRIALAVFSPKYTESEWCLDELVKIMERADLGMIKVIPIFYKVPTSDVENISGEFGKNFEDLEWSFKFKWCREGGFANFDKRFEGWRNALECVTNIIGFPLDENRLESDFIKDIVNSVLRSLKNISSAKQDRDKIKGTGKGCSSSAYLGNTQELGCKPSGQYYYNPRPRPSSNRSNLVAPNESTRRASTASSRPLYNHGPATGSRSRIQGTRSMSELESMAYSCVNETKAMIDEFNSRLRVETQQPFNPGRSRTGPSGQGQVIYSNIRYSIPPIPPIPPISSSYRASDHERFDDDYD